MNRYEKIAWFNLAVSAVSIILYLILFLSLSAQVAISAFALTALCAFGPLMFNKTGAIIDEKGTIIRQKYIWYKYVLFGAVCVSIFFGVWIWKKTVSTMSDQAVVLIAFLYVSIFALLTLILHLCLKRQEESGLISDEQSFADDVLYGPIMDERDLKIQRAARWSGFVMFWLFYVFGITGTLAWLIFKGYSSISIDVSVLPLFVFGAAILIIIVDSITRVILYRRGK